MVTIFKALSVVVYLIIITAITVAGIVLEKPTRWLLAIYLFVYLMAVCLALTAMLDNSATFIALGLADCGVIVSFIMSLYDVKKKH